MHKLKRRFNLTAMHSANIITAIMHILKTEGRQCGERIRKTDCRHKEKGDEMQFFKGNNPYMQSVIKRSVALAVMIVITVSSVITVAASTCNAVIDYNGEKKSVQLLSNSTEDILKTAGINVKSVDLVTRSQAESGGDVLLMVKSGYNVTVSADGFKKSVTVHFGDTVADALSKAGVTPGTNDLVEPPESTKVSDGMQISVKRKFDITIIADGQSKAALVPEGTVEDALAFAGVSLGAEDTVTPAKSAAVAQGSKITIARVTYNDVTTTKPIAYTNSNVNDDTLYQGVKKVKTAGKNGTQSIVTRQKLVDSKVVSSSVTSTTVTVQPVTQVTLVGTKKRPPAVASISGDGTLVDHLGNTVSYSRRITGRCTAYSGGGHTSTGRAASFGLVAVNPSIIPYGTRLYICSPDGRTVYGYATAADTGTGVMTGRILADLYYSSNAQCRDFGVRNMSIYIL